MDTRTTFPPNPQEFIPLSKAAGLFPSNPSLASLWRWGRKGVMSRNGERLRLRIVRSGRKLYTKPIWVEQFLDKLAEADAEAFAAEAEEIASAKPPSASTRTRSPKRRERDVKAAQRRLAARGL